MPNRKKWIRYVLYAVEILLLFLLQDTPGLLPQIMGVKPLPVLSAALTIAMVEACTPAMAFGMYAGFLADIGSGAVFGYHALTFGVLCFLLSGLCGTRIQIQLFTSVLMGLWSCAVAVLLDWVLLDRLDDLNLWHGFSSEFVAVTLFLSHTTYPKGGQIAIHKNH